MSSRLVAWTFCLRRGDESGWFTFYATRKAVARGYAEEWAKARGYTVELVPVGLFDEAAS